MGTITKIKYIFQRVFLQTWDLDHIGNIIFNEAAGAQMNLNVEPVISRTYTANTPIQYGSYIKVATGTTAYTMDCIGKAYDPAYTNYKRGDLVTNSGNIYIATISFVSGVAAGTFDATKWTKVAAKQIANIPVTGGAVVCVGKYHNAISVSGFVVDDTSVYARKG